MWHARIMGNVVPSPDVPYKLFYLLKGLIGTTVWLSQVQTSSSHLFKSPKMKPAGNRRHKVMWCFSSATRDCKYFTAFWEHPNLTLNLPTQPSGRGHQKRIFHVLKKVNPNHCLDPLAFRGTEKLLTKETDILGVFKGLKRQLMIMWWNKDAQQSDKENFEKMIWTFLKQISIILKNNSSTYFNIRRITRAGHF